MSMIVSAFRVKQVLLSNERFIVKNYFIIFCTNYLKLFLQTTMFYESSFLYSQPQYFYRFL
jgi:hypothetical protein